MPECLSTRKSGMNFWPHIPLPRIADLIGYRIHSLPILMHGTRLPKQGQEVSLMMTEVECFWSQQTYKGLKITVSSLIDVVKFLISEGMEFVLSERFCQDLLEEYFGRQRERGRFSDNPTVQAFGYNDRTLAVQRNIAPVVKGNVAGRHKGESSKWYVVSEEPLPKRKK